MPIRINLKELIGSDSQGVTVDKLNFNFNKLLELGVGSAGPKGDQGNQGSAGPIGGPGSPGTRGSLWYTGSGVPSAGPTPPNPGGIGVRINDLYVDGDTGDQYDWDGNNWNKVTDFDAVVSTAVSTATSIAFIRDLDVPSAPSRFITFKNRGIATGDILGGSSGNDMLYLNNFPDSAVTLVEADYFTSLLKINTDYRSGNSNKRHAIQIGSFYNPADTSLAANLSETKHDIKISHVHGGALSSGSTTDFFIGSFNMSVPLDGTTPGTQNDFESMFEFKNAKSNLTELVTRIGPKDALQKSFSEAVSNGISFSLDGVNAEIGILEDYKIFTNSSDENYLVLQGDETQTDAVLIKDKLVQDGGNIIQTGTGEFLIKGSSSIISHGTGTPTDQQNYGNCGIVKVGDTITVVQGSSSTTPEPGLSIADTTLKGVISVFNATVNTSLESYNSKIGGSLETDFIGVSASDIKVVGNYAYIAHNTLPYDYNYNPYSATRDNVDLTILDYSTFKDQNTVDNFKLVSRVEKGSGYAQTSRCLHRIEVVGNIAIASSQALRTFGDPDTSIPPNNFLRNGNNIFTFDVSNPKEKGIVALHTANLDKGSIDNFQSLDLAVKERYAYVMGLAFTEVGAANTNLSYEQFVYRVLIDDVSNTDYHNITNYGEMYKSASTGLVNSTNHNDGTLSKFGSISINGRHLYSMYRNELRVLDIEEVDKSGSLIYHMPVVNSSTFSSNVNIRSIDSKIVGNSLYILYSIASGSPGTVGYAYDTSGSSGVIKMDIRTPESPVEVWDKEISGCGAASRMTIDGNHIYVAQSLAATGGNRVFTLEIDGIVADHIDTGYIDADKVHTEEVQADVVNAVAINSDKIHAKELSAEKVRVQYHNASGSLNDSCLMSMNYLGVPIGGIIMWHGDPALVGNIDGDLWNFKICDGGTITNAGITGPDGTLYETPYGGGQTPNLQGRFPLGADGSSYTFGQQGGSPSTSITVDETMLPKHRHGPGTLNITASGGHRHQMRYRNAGTAVGADNGDMDVRRGSNVQNLNINHMDSATHVHLNSDFAGKTEYAGGNYDSSGNFQSQSPLISDTFPSYHVVTFIIRLV